MAQDTIVAKHSPKMPASGCDTRQQHEHCHYRTGNSSHQMLSRPASADLRPRSFHVSATQQTLGTDVTGEESQIQFEESQTLPGTSRSRERTVDLPTMSWLQSSCSVHQSESHLHQRGSDYRDYLLLGISETVPCCEGPGGYNPSSPTRTLQIDTLQQPLSPPGTDAGSDPMDRFMLGIGPWSPYNLRDDHGTSAPNCNTHLNRRAVTI
ncbi:hypothetical protein NA57DRAFT_51674 [Rhizodiscina lignyota]|uniref:Uncharacterized protein n=1 Tax=Rhizodiscina lignyota TaxID=1504668 RepID=A0A9P4IT38_9PEZI|nr:hypothetical protein NA57DRAFT_51674 [Rhizodiscina lignyota]